MAKECIPKSDENNSEQFLLVRIPKSINPDELDGLQLNLSAKNLDGKKNMIDSSQDNCKFVYDLIPSEKFPFHPINKIEENNGDLRLNRDCSLLGCLNFYKWHRPPNEELKPLIQVCPNDPIENIVNRNQSYFSSKKRKSNSSELSHKKKS